MHRPPLVLYNLFPSLLGPMSRWAEWVTHIRGMGFNWIYLNPFHLPGHSGSLYAVKDYYLFHPLFSTGHEDFSHVAEQRTQGERALRHFLDVAHRAGLKVAMDLVANHTATDNPLVRQHPEWFKWSKKGRIIHPGARHGRKRVVWGDLAQLDHRSRPEGRALRTYLLHVVEHYLRLGIDGFRCDAAYKIPTHFWKPLLNGARKVRRDAVFMGETLGCSEKETLRIQKLGFDYVFNNFRWWHMGDSGFLHGYNRLAPRVASIAFPESHDTTRLAHDVGGDRALCLQKYVLAALFSTGVMMPLGFEYGARKKPDVSRTRPRDLEAPHFDLRHDIAHINQLKLREPILQVDAPLHPISTERGLMGYVKEAHGQRLVVLAHTGGGSTRAQLSRQVLGPQPRVIYGLRQLDATGLQAQLVHGEVFASVSPIRHP